MISDFLKLCDRKEKIDGNADGWALKKEWRTLLGKFDGIEVLDQKLTEKEINDELVAELKVDEKLMNSAAEELSVGSEWDKITELLPEEKEQEQLMFGIDEDE